MPPQAGFVSEWYLFQTFFQGFHLSSLASRLVAALAGAGLALTVAIAFATFVKAFGIGLLGRARDVSKGAPWPNLHRRRRARLSSFSLWPRACRSGSPVSRSAVSSDPFLERPCRHA